ncbi:zinc finger protein 423-like isoform X2 [Tachypleus tridentatus]|uniref:zinc finger protein 423-like isoform X2 n=1 Tax=Tachypleus tridentatus TaxID=6853 RepID=UPI003FD04AB8
MSRRKQAKPRALKRDEVGEEFDDESPEEDESLLAPLSGSEKNFTDHIITGLNGGTGTPTSWRSTDTPDDQSLSLSPTSCATPSDPDVDLTYTIGVTENTPYACQFCDKAFPRLSYLKRHEQIHSDQMPFKCDYCQRLFKHKRSRDRHIKLHTGDKKYRCPHCESAFSRSDHLKIHLKTHDHAKPFQCTVCNRGYNTAAALTSHMQNHKKESAHTSSNAQSQSQSFRCLQCSAFFSTAKDLQTHVETHREGSASPNEKTSQCAFCHEFCPSPGALRLHVEQSHPSEAQGKCPECREIFPSLQALVHHKKIHIDVEMENIDETVEKKKESNKFLCGFCAKSGFSTLDSLQLHVQKEHVPTSGENMGHFLLNSPSFGNIPSLALTCQQHQVYGIKGNFICEYCNMKFGSVHSLQKHTLTVHSFTDLLSKMQENIFCSECKLGFPTSGALAEHINTLHEGRKNESPNNDPSPSASKDSILINTSLSNNVGSWDKSSMQTKPQSATESPINETVPHFPHSGPLLCSQCNAAFPDFESFRTHLKTHLDAVIQKYTCSECEVEFPTEQQLNAHVMTHFLSTSTEYGCRCCLKLFSKPDELQKHLMDIHAHHLYRCSLCKEIFDSKVSIQVHFAVKHSNECRLFKCTSCNAVFHSEMEFQLHVKVMHLFKIHPFRCLLCDQCFSTEYELQYHLNTHKKQFSCAVCDEAFHVEFLLDKHMEVCHNSEVRGSSVDSLSNQPSISTDGVQNLSLKQSNDKPETPLSSVEYRKHFSCEICDGIFSSETHLSSHCRQVHNIRIPCFQKFGQTTFSLFCAYCNESCKSRTELENHMKAHTVSPSKHKCNICDEICPTAATLAEHKLSHCKVMTGGVCVTCKKTVQNEEEFYKHIQEHNANGLPVPCVVCRQTLMSDVEIQVHAKFHLKTRDPLYPCCVCARQFEANKLIITGKQDNGHTYMCKDCFHARSEDLRCPECKVKFETVSALEKHKLTHKKTYQCIKCQMSFESETEIQAHVTSHMIQEGTSHECKLCHTVFESPAKLQCHLIEHTFEGCSCYTCYMCSTVFTAPHLIQQHMLEHGLSSRPYDCSHCHQRFFFRAELENHSHMHKENIDSGEQLNCPDCTKVFNSIVNLNNHRKIHEQKNNTLKCSSCPELFHNSADMQQHYFRYHGDSELDGKNKCFPCTECGKEFPCLSNLQGHVRIHAQGTKYTCPECKKEFALSRNLNIHLRSHSGEKPYECPVCKKRFARKENRKAHLKSHTGLKPFMCPHCGKTFSRKCHVKEHMRIHITSTTHPCELCTETFRSLKQLKRHLMDAHQKQYDHVCSVCGDVFNQSKNLQTHMQNKHDVRPTNSENDLIDVLSEFSPSQSSASGDIKDFEGSETNSLVEEGDTRGSSVSATQDKVTLPTEVAA